MQTVLRVSPILVLLQCASAFPALAGEVVQVTISELTFSPAVITARVGDTVQWVNDDFIDHTATTTEGSWDVMLDAGKAAQWQLKKAGSFDYICRFHPNMTGKIQVSAD